MSAPNGGAGGGGGGQATPNATVGSVHSRKPVGAIPAKPKPGQVKKAPAKRKR